MNVDYNLEKEWRRVVAAVKSKAHRMKRVRQFKIKDQRDLIKDEILNFVNNVSILIHYIIIFCSERLLLEEK